MTDRIASSAVLLIFASTGRSDDAAKIEHFEAKIRPILAQHCIQCHGAKKQKGGLRLDLRDAALSGGESGKALVPGKPNEGELLKAVRYDPDGYRMPPTGKLPDAVVTDLERWVKDGAHWPAESSKQNAKADNAGDWFEQRRREHWCWQPVKRTPAPVAKDSNWSFGDIDAFLLKSMEREGLAPSKDADRFTLLRRLHFLMTGLPPTQEEIEAFTADTDEASFERTVDRLLASPEFGERWARHWLDLVRFSETLGHEFDFDIPNAWRYRDYVIRALNDDLPYDRFVVEHVAGDLLPQPRLDAKRQSNESIVGTAFWWFGEAKQAPVDVKAEQADHVDNQIDVLSKTFLGLTVSCARCHDHKFDAISAADYYSLYGFLKSTRYSQASTIPVSRWREEVASRSRLEQETRSLVADRWKAMIAAFDDQRKAAAILKAAESQDDASEPNPKSLILGEAKVGFLGWRRSGPAALLAETQVGDPILSGNPSSPVARLHEVPSFNTARWGNRLQGSLRSPTFVIDRPFLNVFVSGTGSRFNVVVDNFNVIRAPIYGGLRAKLDTPAAKWRTIDVKAWMGHEAYIEFLDQTAADLGDPDQREYPADAWFAVERVLLSDAPQTNDPKPQPSSKKLVPVVEWKAEQRTEAALPRLKRRATDALAAWRSGSPTAPTDARLLNRMIEAGVFRLDNPMPKLVEIENERRRLDSQLPEYAATPGAEDGDGRDESVFIRGNTKKLGPPAPRRFLAAIDERVVRDEGSGRLALAKKIVDPRNPLAARVVVNRVWRHVFGRGLVESPDNFGVLGEKPSHPELLDFLADQFVKEGWSIKRLVRRLVTTHAFRLSSEAASELRTKDPNNRWLARANVRRLDAEPLRDSMLSISDRRSRAMYGPGVLVHLDEFADGRGKPKSGPLDGDGRRTVYLTVRRNFPSSFLSAFDAPIPSSPIGKRSVSSVPAQALILLNDPFVVHSARLTAKSLIGTASRSSSERVQTLYLQAFGRPPTGSETKAAKLFLSNQTSVRNGDEAAAWADLCHALFNAKEFLFLR